MFVLRTYMDREALRAHAVRPALVCIFEDRDARRLDRNRCDCRSWHLGGTSGGERHYVESSRSW